MAAGTAYIVGSLITAAVSAGASKVEYDTSKKTEKQTALRHEEQLRLQKELASQVTAPVTKLGGNVEVRSSEAIKDEEIKDRSARSRLRVSKKSTKGVGTGLRVG